MQLPKSHSATQIICRVRFLFYSLLIIPNSLLAQPSYEAYINEAQLSVKTRMAYDLYHHFIRYDLDSIKIASMELLLSDNVDANSFAENMAHRMLGAYLIRSGSINKGLHLLKKSANFYERKQDFLMTSEIYNDIGHGLSLNAEYDEAVVAYQTSIDLGQYSSDPTSLFNADLGMAKALILNGDTLNAERHLINYRVQTIKFGKYEAASDATSFLANLFLAMGKTQQGLSLMRESVDLSLKSRSEIHRSHAYTNLAIYYFEKEEFDSAQYYFHRSLDLRNALNNTKSIIEAHYNLGDFYRLTHNKVSASKHYELSQKIASGAGMLRDEIDAVEGILNLLSNDANQRTYDSWSNLYDSLQILTKEKRGVSDSIIDFALSLSNTETWNREHQKEGDNWILIVIIGLSVLTGILTIVKWIN